MMTSAEKRVFAAVTVALALVIVGGLLYVYQEGKKWAFTRL